MTINISSSPPLQKNQQQVQSNGHPAKQLPLRRHITLELIRKRSEHNEGLVSTLEEIALHQEELESIGPILGRTCGKTLKILLLQNNVIDRMDPKELKFFRRLEYLNLAINNITRVQGIEHMEFLQKLDLTLNFIDYDHLESSIACMKDLLYLNDLYLVGNPCSLPANTSQEQHNQDFTDAENTRSATTEAPLHAQSKNTQAKRQESWKGYRFYVIGKLPQLKYLDGIQITRSERIQAKQMMHNLEEELIQLSKSCQQHSTEDFTMHHIRKDDSSNQAGNNIPTILSDEEMTEHCPQVRSRISYEMALQKAEKETNEKANQPKTRGEKEFEEEQELAIERARIREENGNIRQCNEGKWEFFLDEEKRPGFILLTVVVQKHLSSSLIDVDVHPSYVSIVIKSKLLRLLLPCEVKAEQTVAQRSTTTGHLLLSMPKFQETILPSHTRIPTMTMKQHLTNRSESRCALSKDCKSTRKQLPSYQSLGATMMQETNVHMRRPGTHDTLHIHEISSRRKQQQVNLGCEESFDFVPPVSDDEPPPIFL